MRTGVDIVKISRIKTILDKSKESFYRRIFTDSEVEYITKKNHDHKTVAGMFASKESISKLIGTGIGEISWKDIEVSHDESGRPYVLLNEKLNSRLSDLNLNNIELSISHEEEYAIAFSLGYLRDEEYTVPIYIKELLPIRDVNSHKGTYGKVGIIAGSKGMTGAPYLSSTAALKSGSGLVYSIVTSDIEDIMSIKLTEVIVKSYEDLNECLGIIKKMDGILVGPGLGQNEDKKMLVNEIISNFNGPIVLDADGINVVNKDLLYSRNGLTIITPHPGELARFLDKDTKEIQDNRIYYSKYTSQKYNVITVLKGHDTLVTTKENLYINKTGNPGMATAGSGDVLGGMIISFIGQGIEPFKACILATFCHGLAGDIAEKNIGDYGLIASDILEYIPVALKRIQF